MKVGLAKEIATKWVMENASQEDWFRGAYFSGSSIMLPDDAELSASSDIDIMLVTGHDEVPLKLGKFKYNGILLEVTYLSWNLFTYVPEVLSSYHLANSFRIDTIIADPTGYLRKLQKEVSKQFGEKEWVLKRCKNAREKIENGFKNPNYNAPWYDLVMGWLFSTGITTHVLLVAAQENPTVRKRYLAARKVLMKYDKMDLYEELLTLQGSQNLSPEQVEKHLDALAETFDITVSVSKTPFFFSTDISNICRPIAIGGSRELIRAGYHREAIFWIVATFTRCHKILAADGTPEMQEVLKPAFDAVVSDLGITSTDDIRKRGKEVIQFLPKLWDTAEEIIQER